MKNYSTYFLIFLLFILTILAGINYYFKPFAPKQKAIKQVVPSPIPTPEFDLSTMSTKDKVAQILAVPVLVESTTRIQASKAATLVIPDNTQSTSTQSVKIADDQILDSYSNWVVARKPGIGVVFGENLSVEDFSNFKKSIEEGLSGIETFWAVDHEGGGVQRLSGSGFTTVPSWQEVCNLEASERTSLYQQVMSELSVAGINIVLGPVVDYGTSSVLKNRICDANTEVVTARTQEYINVAKEFGILPVIKHFPGIGKSKVDLHKKFDSVEINPEDAKIYRSLLEVNKNIGVMVSHIGVTNQLPDVPCSLSSACVGQLVSNYPAALRFTDALEMDAAGQTQKTQASSLEERAISAIKAGNDVLLFGQIEIKELERVYWHLVSAYESDPIIQQKVDKAVERILELKNLED